MFFLRVVSVLCGTALLLAFCADATILLIAHVAGGFGIVAKGRFGWVLFYFFFWVLSFVPGWFIARGLHVFPFVR